MTGLERIILAPPAIRKPITRMRVPHATATLRGSQLPQFCSTSTEEGLPDESQVAYRASFSAVYHFATLTDCLHHRSQLSHRADVVVRRYETSLLGRSPALFP